ncbi:hypothetical protein GCM10007981_14680 [Thermocladium modestius]|uniref:KEOPS complex subunit n=1 Tax=Thermocladium modestius TaxID=62609 RepID=A0A830GWW2_9CREN|nr:KEOPS complex subunit Pcc1 [Thermocladium modestius]GGP21721.1 hypothetical protein GCM10007981_14680 [Thermocladium modestius]
MDARMGRGRTIKLQMMSASLYIEVGNECDVVAKSLMVDERDLPSGISTSMKCQDGVLIYEVITSIDEPSSILTAYNTLDDLIRNLRAALAAL